MLQLDELHALVVVDNETGTLSSVEPGVPQLPEVTGLAARLPVSAEVDGKPGKVVFDHLCCAAHGFSVLLTGRRGEQERTVHYDVGPYASTWLDNADRLEVDLALIEAVSLSHWHSDHSGPCPRCLPRSPRRGGRQACLLQCWTCTRTDPSNAACSPPTARC